MTSGSSATGSQRADADSSTVAVVSVTYNPDLEILDRQLSQLPASALKVIVDNASQLELRRHIRRVAADHGAVLLQNDSNLGLPAALNQGARYAQQTQPACEFLLLLDQDTEPGIDGVERLIARYDPIAAAFGKACCIGPRLLDVSTGLEYGFHQITGWRWVRKFPGPDSHAPVPLANLNGSGTLLPLTLFNKLGGFEEDFFIDHVDTEWAFRVLAAGYGLYGVPDITFQHRMGEQSLRFWWFGWRIWPKRSPQRHYYLFRNAVRLMRRHYVPKVWKIWALAKLLLTVLTFIIFDQRRRSQLRSMIIGVRDGSRSNR
ncbi:MAG: glycosyltransferase family 2 protein [Gammaproteobacteria bacterium]